MHCLFYLLVLLAVVVPAIFVWSIWRDAMAREWNWIGQNSRTMYTDVFKTLITASGIAVALVASSSATRMSDSIVKLSTRGGVISLIICICASVVGILALARGGERAISRAGEKGITTGVGQLSNFELLLILIPGSVALSSFLVGLLFLGRITFHT